MNIIERIKEIQANGEGIVYTDAGNGCAGPGYADNATLVEMIEAGDFEDASEVPLDMHLFRASWADVLKGEPSEGTWTWHQIEYAWGEGDNPYHQIAWIWTD